MGNVVDKKQVGTHVLQFVDKPENGFDIYLEPPGGGDVGRARLLEVLDGGGHLEIRRPAGNGDTTAAELDEDGRVVIHDV